LKICFTFENIENNGRKHTSGGKGVRGMSPNDLSSFHAPVPLNFQVCWEFFLLIASSATFSKKDWRFCRNVSVFIMKLTRAM
jgi:hypothetical protein